MNENKWKNYERMIFFDVLFSSRAPKIVFVSINIIFLNP